MQYLTVRSLIIVLLPLFLFASCARKAAFEKSVAAPSATGRVKVKKGDNSNYSIDVEIRDLTTPDQLIPPKKVYIVWNEASNGVFNIGRIETSRSFLSRGFKAELETSSPNRPNRVFVTAEENANTLYPGPQVVLTTPSF